MFAAFSPSFFGSHVGLLGPLLAVGSTIPWNFCQLPILAAVHKHITAKFDYIWYLEYDVAWVGDLAGVLNEIDSRFPVADYIASECQCGMCGARGYSSTWHGCYIRTPGYVKHKDTCGCLVQVVRYSSRLLEVLYTHWMEGKRAYCEVAPMTACSLLDWCKTAQIPRDLTGEWVHTIDEHAWSKYEHDWATKNGDKDIAPGRLYHKSKWRYTSTTRRYYCVSRTPVGGLSGQQGQFVAGE